MRATDRDQATQPPKMIRAQTQYKNEKKKKQKDSKTFIVDSGGGGGSVWYIFSSIYCCLATARKFSFFIHFVYVFVAIYFHCSSIAD